MLAGRSDTKEVNINRSLYANALIGNSLLIVLTLILGSEGIEFGKYIAGVACGLQNGMCTFHLGAICRTTHVTGLATDLGTTLGRLVSITFSTRCLSTPLDEWEKVEVDIVKKRLHVYLLLGGGFLGGGFAGAWLFHWFALNAIVVPAILSFFCGVAAYVCKAAMGKRMQTLPRKEQKIEEVKESVQRTMDIVTQLKCFNPDNAEVDQVLDLMKAMEASVKDRYPDPSSM